MTIDEIMESCAESRADDWAFWVYLCGNASAAQRPPQEAGMQEQDLAGCARAVYLAERAIGLAWSPADDGEPYHWVELLYEGAVVDRQLAVWVDGAHASLPVPSAEPDGGGRSTPWVSRRSYRLIRLANEVDPDCSDFDDYFAGSGIELH
jgi:hypothetical protein